MPSIHRLLGRRPDPLAPAARRLQLNRICRTKRRGSGLRSRFPFGPRIDGDRLRSTQRARSRSVDDAQYESHQGGAPGQTPEETHRFSHPPLHHTYNRHKVPAPKVRFPITPLANHRIARQELFQTFRLNGHARLFLFFPNSEE